GSATGADAQCAGNSSAQVSPPGSNRSVAEPPICAAKPFSISVEPNPPASRGPARAGCCACSAGRGRRRRAGPVDSAVDDGRGKPDQPQYCEPQTKRQSATH